MRPSAPLVTPFAALLVWSLAIAGAPRLAAQHAAPSAPARAPIGIPAGAPTPVLLDGQLSAGEWDDARVVALAGPDSARLLVKQFGGHVFLAFVSGTRVPRPVDLFVARPDGSVHQLHASMQIGERIHPDTLWSDTLPAWHWGNHVDWIANEAKLDARRPQDGSFGSRLFPATATEFQIRRARFPESEWRLRVEVNAFSGADGALVLPHGATRDPGTWIALRLE